MKHISTLLGLLAASALVLSGCSRNLDGSTYTSGAPVGKVIYGTVLSARQVTVKDHDRLEQNGVGGLAGGVAGGFAGSSIGKGTGRGVAGVGGAVAGAVLGAMIQDQLSTSTGIEYIVQLDKTAPTKLKGTRKSYNISGKRTVSDDLNDSIEVADTESQAIAVIQQDPAPIAAGTRVAVIYSDDRPRIVPLAH